MKRIALILIAGLTTVTGYAQKRGIQEGDRLLKTFEYAEAAGQYSEVVNKYPNNVEANEKLARAYVLAGNHAGAEAAYANVVKLPDAPVINHYYYALELRANGKYEEAEKEFEAYAQANPNDPRATEFAGSLEKINALSNDKNEFTVNLFPLNSPESDIAPSYYKEGVVFSSDRGKNTVIVNGQFYDLYIGSNDASGNLASVKKWKAKPINKTLHEGTAVFSADGNEIYFTGSNRTKGEYKLGKNKEVNLKIYHAVYDSTKKQWTDINPLPFCSNEYSVTHPSLSKDGRRLYFVSDMPDGYGETDIYVSYRYGSTWGKPINLGKNVNTAGSELFPYVTDSALYFASDSRVGLGGLDIYFVTFDGKSWGSASAQNLGAPFNTNFDDFGFITDESGDKGYFVSNRPGGLGSDDIYAFERKIPRKKKSPVVAQNTAEQFTTKSLKNQFVKEALGNWKSVTLDSSATHKVTKKVWAETVKEEVVKTETVVAPEVKTALEPQAEASVKTEAVAAPEVKTALEAQAEAVEAVVKATIEAEVPAVTAKSYSLSVSVSLAENKGSADGTIITLTNTATGKTQSNVISSASAPKFSIEPDQNYELSASKVSADKNGKYSSPIKAVSTRGITADLTEAVELNYLEVGQVIKEDIHYDFNKWTIKPSEEYWLNKIVKYMKVFPELELELSAHTDCVGSAEYNKRLSTQRLQACLNWLAERGVNVKRIFAVAHGKSKPAVNCECEKCTDAENQANRRIEIRVLKVE